MHPLERYLTQMRQLRATGGATPELSYYGALEGLLNAVGSELSPEVRALPQPADAGAGHPDFGLYTESQCRAREGSEPRPGQPPARGVVEVKDLADDSLATASGVQVSTYWDRYRQVLVTNYRDFVLVGQKADGSPGLLESFSLADDVEGFWSLAQHPRRAANDAGDRFVDFLTRIMLRPAPLTEPRDLAWFLASYAREALARMEGSRLRALSGLREALEEALGMQFQGEEGEHFFRSTLVQTLFYGVFSAWVLWSRDNPPSETSATFDWMYTTSYLHVPVLRKLYHEISDAGQLRRVGLLEVLDWTGDVLNRVDRDGFFAAFEEQQAVQYFYEPFLEAYDPELRSKLGVWYTPREVVDYQVERVDTVLREELGIDNGLADPNVYVLDPCCGTGAYLVSVLQRIERTLREGTDDALVANDLKTAAMERVFGFEILPASYVVAHLQMGMTLGDFGAPLGREERAGIYLTNALTGWEPPEGPQSRLAFMEFEEERDAAQEVKQEKPILVILGNPPYYGYAGVAMAEERELSEAYRTTDRAPAPEGQGLNDLYVRFYRMAERRIVEKTGKGVVCFISNYSWLDGLSFTGMREHYLSAFDSAWIDCLNGDKYKTGKVTPWGEPDPSIFSTEFNREGIQVGTAIGLLVRNDPGAAEPGGATEEGASVFFRHLWGRRKREELLETADNDGRSLYEELEPSCELGFPFMPLTLSDEYFAWPRVPELMPVSFPGVKTSRDDLVVDIDRERLVERMEQYFDPAVSDQEMARICPRTMESTARFDARAVRRKLIERGFLPEKVVRYCYRPLDLRWLYWEPDTKLLDEKRSEYIPHVQPGNVWLSSGRRNRKLEFYAPQCTSRLADHHIVESNVAMFPRTVYPNGGQSDLFNGAPPDEPRPNLTNAAHDYLEGLGYGDMEVGTDALFHHVLAVLHAPLYRTENGGALRQDWPRVPLPDGRTLLEDSAALGSRLADLLNPEAETEGVTTGDLPPPLTVLGLIAHEAGRPLNPGSGDLAVTAGWGYAGVANATMPGQGKIIERAYTDEEAAALGEATDLLGETTRDIYLNEDVFWGNVPERVWGYTLGGYPVIKKWLSYREQALLGRALTPEEARYVTEMVRRIAAILLMGPTLDENYRAAKDAATELVD